MIRVVAPILLVTSLVLGYVMLAQTPADPFSIPIPATEDVVLVRFSEFASIPDIDGVAARIMLLVDEPGTRRMFVNDMRGPLYTVSYDGRVVTQYLDVNAPRWGVRVQSTGRERGLQSFAIHPQFGLAGTPGFGKLYTWTDTSNTVPEPDFVPGGGNNTHATVLLEWTAKTPAAATYDGGPPREVLRLEQPFANHNGGHLSFNPLAMPGSADFGLLYVGAADGGSGGDPLQLGQSLRVPFGKILRIDPLGRNSANGKYGVPASNPFASDGDAATLGEIYVSGVRNPQRFGWDSRNGNLFVADIGQDIVEELSVAEAGANLGWNQWEGSFGFVSREAIDLGKRRGDPAVTYPVAEYAQIDPLLQRQSAITGVHVYRRNTIPQLQNLVLFGDFPSGEIFYIHADELPSGGQEAIRRVLLNDDGVSKTFLQVIQEKNVEQGKPPAARADLRFGDGPDGQVFLTNKHDGTIRLLIPDSGAAR
jgi:glucose/arabinose dehydrogenase